MPPHCKVLVAVLVLAGTLTEGFQNHAATTTRHPLPRLAQSPLLLSASRWHSSTRLRSTAAPTAENDGDKKKIPLFEPFGKGAYRDFSRRLPFYKSDITDGLNAQSLATTLFLFFACLAPAIGFGGLLDTATAGAMGTIEMTLSTSLCGVLYALLAPQPIQLIGPMGPVLAFTVSLYQLATILKLPFLPLYAWTGLWTSGMLLTCALTSASHVVQYLTRFTDEIFSTLISAIFLLEAIMNITASFTSPVSTPIKALLTLTCATVTFGSAKFLKGLTATKYFSKRLRTNLSNFAPAIGVLLGSLVARAARIHWGVGLGALQLPATALSTTSGRPWLIPLFNNALPSWAIWGASLPALLCTVLLFLDQNITARLVNNPRYKMTKGRTGIMDGMHGDMVVLAGLTAITSVLGLPWMAGATTRSAAHVRSLSVVENNAEDGTPVITGTLENRVSGAAIHALIGASVLFAGPRQLLTQVPLAVLSGVFLYLGLTSLQGLELWDRIQGLIQEDDGTKRWSGIVGRKTTTVVTLTQMAAVGLMMWVTKSPYGVVSPMLVVLLPLLRKGLGKVVSKKDLNVLDQ